MNELTLKSVAAQSCRLAATTAGGYFGKIIKIELQIGTGCIVLF